MRYSRNKINVAGQALLAGPETGFPYFDANLMIEDWRSLHMLPLEHLVNSITSLLAEAGIAAAFSSHRLKRMTSIISKLRHFPDMRLGGVQDIGGARFVFEDIPSLLKAKEVIANSKLDSFIPDRNIYDYVTTEGVGPKQSGYRSIHFVYKFVSDDPDYDGLRIELQIRTRLQHDWAMAVETAELLSQSPLKAGLGNQYWMDFFKLASAVFAKREGMPVEQSYVNMTEQDFCVAYARLEKEYRFLDQLQGLVNAVKITEQHLLAAGYAVIFIHFVERTVQLRHYSNEELAAASKYYSDVEKSINNNEAAVVLVSVSDMKELQEAYPSYFLNASEFVQALHDFNQTCITKHYI